MYLGKEKEEGGRRGGGEEKEGGERSEQRWDGGQGEVAMEASGEEERRGRKMGKQGGSIPLNVRKRKHVQVQMHLVCTLAPQPGKRKGKGRK